MKFLVEHIHYKVCYPFVGDSNSSGKFSPWIRLELSYPVSDWESRLRKYIQMQKSLESKLNILLLSKWSHRPSQLCSLWTLEWCLYFEHLVVRYGGLTKSIQFGSMSRVVKWIKSKLKIFNSFIIQHYLLACIATGRNFRFYTPKTNGKS